ncbi:hypothetical protein [Ferrimicrobium acidiphilum]|uniref:hypothetical protein n=1 Tax=Ferrimicrobium acidiphilum TaxID=121039 RepID=UPI0034DD7791
MSYLIGPGTTPGTNNFAITKQRIPAVPEPGQFAHARQSLIKLALLRVMVSGVNNRPLIGRIQHLRSPRATSNADRPPFPATTAFESAIAERYAHHPPSSL